MDNDLIDIQDYTGEGYQPLVDFGTWRVAMLRYLDAIQPDRIDTMERHIETDEVFVLLRGEGVLILGGNFVKVEGIVPIPMEPGKIYNVKRNCWHTILLTRDASVLLVENRDTSTHNSEYLDLSAQVRADIIHLAHSKRMI